MENVKHLEMVGAMMIVIYHNDRGECKTILPGTKSASCIHSSLSEATAAAVLSLTSPKSISVKKQPVLITSKN